jgi:hypothetical protein
MYLIILPNRVRKSIMVMLLRNQLASFHLSKILTINISLVPHPRVISRSLRSLPSSKDQSKQISNNIIMAHRSPCLEGQIRQPQIMVTCLVSLIIRSLSRPKFSTSGLVWQHRRSHPQVAVSQAYQASVDLGQQKRKML